LRNTYFFEAHYRRSSQSPFTLCPRLALSTSPPPLHGTELSPIPPSPHRAHDLFDPFAHGHFTNVPTGLWHPPFPADARTATSAHRHHPIPVPHMTAHSPSPDSGRVFTSPFTPPLRERDVSFSRDGGSAPPHRGRAKSCKCAWQGERKERSPVGLTATCNRGGGCWCDVCVCAVCRPGLVGIQPGHELSA